MGHLEVVKILLQDKRIDPSIYDNHDVYFSAIQHASTNGHTEVVKLLLEDRRVDPAVAGSGTLRYASDNGHTGVVKILL